MHAFITENSSELLPADKLTSIFLDYTFSLMAPNCRFLTHLVSLFMKKKDYYSMYVYPSFAACKLYATNSLLVSLMITKLVVLDTFLWFTTD